MDEIRPDPELLLKQLASDENRKKVGKLKIFFGYAAGVGKTYAMLDAAHAAIKAGIEVVAGYIEPHTRPETLALLKGLEHLEPLVVHHKGVVLKEFDLDAAIARKPQLILVDELAHTNAAGCRHLKRYQDIEELLRAGIDVFTTVNVQHIESLNDIVASITGITVRERIPDRVFDSAYQVELVDIEPDDLIERLNQGKIYRQRQAQDALGHFFTKDNLVALREIALRRTADRVNKTIEKNKVLSQNKGYFTGEHILICLSASPSNAKVIRTAARMADAFRGNFTALFVETPDFAHTGDPTGRLRENLKLAEKLGARIATVYGEDIPYQISEYAKLSGVSKIVVGRSNNQKRLFFTKQSFVERLTQLAPNVDIYIIPDTHPPYVGKLFSRVKVPQLSPVDFGKSVGLLALCTLIGLWFYDLGFSEANIITIYILGVLLTAVVTSGRFYGMVSSLFSVLVFNFFFTVPRFSLQAYDASYPVTFLVMFLAAVITSTLTKRVKAQARQAALKAHRTEVLLETSQKLQRAKNSEEILQETAKQLIRLLDRDILLYSAAEGHLGEPVVYPHGTVPPKMELLASGDEKAVAQWVFRNNKHAGATTDTIPGARCLYMAIRSHDTVFAVVAIDAEKESALDSFEKNLLISMLGECALALEKEQLNESKHALTLQAQREQLRANLLRTISHDLRTPLTSISGSAGILMTNSEILDEERKQRLYTDIYDDSMWLINLVENLLAVTRIDEGSLQLHLEPELLEEVITEALHHINRKKEEHKVTVTLPDDLLMAKMDPRLIIQVIINIVDNAIKYTGVGSTINISARRVKNKVLVEISDDGPGIVDEMKEKLFDMFFTGDKQHGDGRRGMGLGLSLCKSIVVAHGGSIYARDHEPHGTVFCFTLQAEEVKCQ